MRLKTFAGLSIDLDSGAPSGTPAQALYAVRRDLGVARRQELERRLAALGR